MTTARPLDATVPPATPALPSGSPNAPKAPLADRLERLPLERLALAVGTMSLAAALSLMLLDLPALAPAGSALPTQSAQAPEASELSLRGAVASTLRFIDDSTDALLPAY